MSLPPPNGPMLYRCCYRAQTSSIFLARTVQWNACLSISRATGDTYCDHNYLPLNVQSGIYFSNAFLHYSRLLFGLRDAKNSYNYSHPPKKAYLWKLCFLSLLATFAFIWCCPYVVQWLRQHNKIAFLRKLNICGKLFARRGYPRWIETGCR